MADDDRPHQPTTVPDGGNGGIYAMVIVVLILLIAGFVWFSGGFDGGVDDPDLELTAPRGEVPEMPEVDVPVDVP